jgi:NADPH-dependent F420 reductase
VTIAIVGGTGPEGSGLALRWAQAGETVVIGSRDPQRASAIAVEIQKQTGGRVSGAENTTACQSAEIIVLTIPFEVHSTMLKQLKPALRPGQIVVDTTVPLAASVGGRPTRTIGVWQGSAAQETAELVPEGVAVVAAFHNVSADLVKQSGPVDCDVIVCSDDKKAAADWLQHPAQGAQRTSHYRIAVGSVRYLIRSRTEHGLSPVFSGISRRLLSAAGWP